ncbi:hypothetical protein VCR4J2_100010 [Vibrio coralliirubri]|nr:hypothetical protein VCR4J2_100010 [Vibrio coralliirubri]
MAATAHGMLSQEINQWLTVMHNNQTNDEKQRHSGQLGKKRL